MIAITKLECVTERDMDLIFMEELTAHETFFLRFLRQAGFTVSDEAVRVGVWHSLCHPILGESDLVLLVQERHEVRHAFLIENKVDAPPQPQQAARYRQRGEAGIARGDWHHFTTCIVAPEKYITGIGDAKLYDGSVSYEWIAQFMAESADQSEGRRRFRASVVLQAIDQNRRGYSPKHDERVTAFHRGYWMQAQQLFPELGMPEPVSKPAGADWIEISSGDASSWFRPATQTGDRCC